MARSLLTLLLLNATAVSHSPPRGPKPAPIYNARHLGRKISYSIDDAPDDFINPPVLYGYQRGTYGGPVQLPPHLLPPIPPPLPLSPYKMPNPPPPSLPRPLRIMSPPIPPQQNSAGTKRSMSYSIMMFLVVASMSAIYLGF